MSYCHNLKNDLRLLQVGSVHSEGLITDEEMDTRETSVINQADNHTGSDSRQLEPVAARPSLNNRGESTYISNSNKQQLNKNNSNLELSLSNSFNDNNRGVKEVK